MSTQTFAFLPLFAFAVGCTPVDNSGGPPPDGVELTFESLTLPGTCGSFRDEAHLVTDDVSLQAFFADCPIPEADRGAWQAAVADLGADEALVHVNVTLGGCLDGFAAEGAFLDGATVNAWVLRENTAFGVDNAACTDDIGEGPAALKVSGAADATSATVTIGEFNPDLPGAPASG